MRAVTLTCEVEQDGELQSPRLALLSSTAGLVQVRRPDPALQAGHAQVGCKHHLSYQGPGSVVQYGNLLPFTVSLLQK